MNSHYFWEWVVCPFNKIYCSWMTGIFKMIVIWYENYCIYNIISELLPYKLFTEYLTGWWFENDAIIIKTNQYKYMVLHTNMSQNIYYCTILKHYKIGEVHWWNIFIYIHRFAHSCCHRAVKYLCKGWNVVICKSNICVHMKSLF